MSERFELKIYTRNYGYVEVEADSLDEAKKKVLDNWDEYASQITENEGWGVETPPDMRVGRTSGSVATIDEHIASLEWRREIAGPKSPLFMTYYDANDVVQGINDSLDSGEPEVSPPMDTEDGQRKVLKLFENAYAEGEGEAWCDALNFCKDDLRELADGGNPSCPRCGKRLDRTSLPERGYKWQCRDCDEDFYDFEVIHETNNNKED